MLPFDGRYLCGSLVRSLRLTFRAGIGKEDPQGFHPTAEPGFVPITDGRSPLNPLAILCHGARGRTSACG